MRSSVLALRIRLHGDSKSRDEYSWEAFQCSVTESTLDRTSVTRSSVQRYDRDSFASRVFPVHAHRCRPRNHHLLRAFQLCEDAPWRRIREERTERERERRVTNRRWKGLIYTDIYEHAWTLVGNFPRQVNVSFVQQNSKLLSLSQSLLLLLHRPLQSGDERYRHIYTHPSFILIPLTATGAFALTILIQLMMMAMRMMIIIATKANLDIGIETQLSRTAFIQHYYIIYS